MSIVPHQTFTQILGKQWGKLESPRTSDSILWDIHQEPQSPYVRREVFFFSLKFSPFHARQASHKANNNKNAFAITFLTSAYGS